MAYAPSSYASCILLAVRLRPSRVLGCGAVLILMAAVSPVNPVMDQPTDEAIPVHDRLELFTDDFVMGKLSGDARKVLQKPEAEEVVFTAEMPWEGNMLAYFCLFQDGERYRMYYRGSPVDPGKKESADAKPHPEVTCMAESRDGIHWTRPVVNAFEWKGSGENNIVWMEGSGAHNFTVFKDENRAAPPEARYKAVAGKGGPRAYQSADGLHWSMTADRPLVTNGTFDSQNLAFWDATRKEYRLYWRINPKSVRGIRTATSKDFATWEKEANLSYPGKPDPAEQDYLDRVQLYTNAIQPYFRAPHLFIGFPTQFIQKNKENPPKFYQTQPLLMTSRDGVKFERWDNPVVPLSAPKDRDGNRGNYMAWGLLQLPGEPDQLSLYASEAGREYGPTRLRRFVYRLDGFVSISAGPEGGELLTKPLLLDGKNLTVNYRTHAGGSMRVEVQNDQEKVLEGFALEDCAPLNGDSTKAVVSWKGNPRLSERLQKGAVRIRFVLKNADLFSMKMEGTPSLPRRDLARSHPGFIPSF